MFLQYLLGFRRLGWDVLFLDRLEPEMCRDAAGQRLLAGALGEFRYLARPSSGRFELGESLRCGLRWRAT